MNNDYNKPLFKSELLERQYLQQDLDYIINSVNEKTRFALSDDADSVLTWIIMKTIIKQKKGIDVPIGVFYAFESVESPHRHSVSYVEPVDDKDIICCDLSLLQGFKAHLKKGEIDTFERIKTIDNHVFKLSDSDYYADKVMTMNLNHDVSLTRYTEKSATSSAYTLLLAAGFHYLYDEDKDKLNKVQQKLLLSIDSAYTALFGNYRGFKQFFRSFWRIDDVCADVVNYKKSTFVNTQRKYHLIEGRGKVPKLRVNIDGSIKVDGKLFDFLKEFKSIDLSIIDEITSLKFTSYITYRAFQYVITDGEICTVDTIKKKKHGDTIINLAVLDKKRVVGAFVDSDSIERSYADYHEKHKIVFETVTVTRSGKIIKRENG